MRWVHIFEAIGYTTPSHRSQPSCSAPHAGRAALPRLASAAAVAVLMCAPVLLVVCELSVVFAVLVGRWCWRR